MFSSENKREDGFTLTEILLVIMVAGIVGAIAIGAFLNQVQKSHDNNLRNDMTQVANKIESALVTAPNAQSMSQVSTTGEFHLKIEGASKEVKVKLSDGVTVQVQPGSKASHYMIAGTTSEGSYKSSNPLIYDSSEGGFTN